MLMLTCPNCGLAAEETEFSPGGAAHIRRAGPGSSDAEFETYLFLRDNPRGVHFERWLHSSGCGKWFNLARSTVTLEIFGSYSATSSPPPDILARITQRNPDWQAKS